MSFMDQIGFPSLIDSGVIEPLDVEMEDIKSSQTQPVTRSQSKQAARPLRTTAMQPGSYSTVR